MSGTTAITSLPNTQQIGNVGINISEKIPQGVHSQLQMQNVMNTQMNASSLDGLSSGVQISQPQISQSQMSQSQISQPQISQPQPQISQPQPQIQQQEMNTLVSNIQQAAQNGGTSLPSRDISQNTQHIAIDPHIQQNNVVNNTNDYLAHMPDVSNSIHQNIKQQNRADNYKYLLEDVQLPLLVGLLFVIFQMPITRLFFKTHFSFLYNNENNYTLKGYIFMSIVFGTSYYISTKLLDNL